MKTRLKRTNLLRPYESRVNQWYLILELDISCYCCNDKPLVAGEGSFVCIIGEAGQELNPIIN